MDRVRFVFHEGVRMLYLDFSGFQDPRDGDEPIRRAEEVVAREPENSVLTLTNVTGSRFDADMAQALWRLARANKPYVRAGAVVGVEGRQEEARLLIQNLSRREFAVFDDIDAAKAWLVERGKAYGPGVGGREPVMDEQRVRFVEHRGVRILYLDFSAVKTTADALAAIAEARAFIATQPRDSLLTLSNVQGSIFNAEIARALWRLARHDRPFVRAGAVIGLEGASEIILNLVRRMSRRKFATFRSREEAMEWLAARSEGVKE